MRGGMPSWRVGFWMRIRYVREGFQGVCRCGGPPGGGG